MRRFPMVLKLKAVLIGPPFLVPKYARVNALFTKFA
jgi:hypothetical protein